MKLVFKNIYKIMILINIEYIKIVSNNKGNIIYKYNMKKSIINNNKFNILLVLLNRIKIYFYRK